MKWGREMMEERNDNKEGRPLEESEDLIPIEGRAARL